MLAFARQFGALEQQRLQFVTAVWADQGTQHGDFPSPIDRVILGAHRPTDVYYR